DIRTFGWIKLVGPEQYEGYLRGYGIDPIAEPFSWEQFASLLKNRRGVVKAFLLNQRYIAVVGNIYGDEILHQARILPGRSLASLSPMEQKRLLRSLTIVLEATVPKRGTSFSNFVDASGRKGGFYKHLRVYDRAGERRLGCGDDSIEKSVIA